MTDKDKALSLEQTLRLALEALSPNPYRSEWAVEEDKCKAITAIKAALLSRSDGEAKDEPWEQFYPEMGKPYAFKTSMYSNDRIKVDPVTGNVSIGTVTMPCGLECDCTDVCKQDDYKALWQQMCERCDELDKKLAQRKPLTNEEIENVVTRLTVSNKGVIYFSANLRDFARAIEAAHGIIDPTDLKGKYHD